MGLDPVGHGKQQTGQEEAQGNGDEGSDGRAHRHLPDRVGGQALGAQHHGMIHERSGHDPAGKAHQRRWDAVHEVERDHGGDEEGEDHVRRGSGQDDRQGDGREHPGLIGAGNEPDERVQHHGGQNGGHHHEKKAHGHWSAPSLVPMLSSSTMVTSRLGLTRKQQAIKPIVDAPSPQNSGFPPR